jgi:hypothetical protein
MDRNLTSGATDPNHDVPEHEEKHEKKQSDASMPIREHNEDEKEYPDLKVVLPIVGAVCLSVFLASLVSVLSPPPETC